MEKETNEPSSLPAACSPSSLPSHASRPSFLDGGDACPSVPSSRCSCCCGCRCCCYCGGVPSSLFYRATTPSFPPSTPPFCPLFSPPFPLDSLLSSPSFPLFFLPWALPSSPLSLPYVRIGRSAPRAVGCLEAE